MGSFELDDRKSEGERLQGDYTTVRTRRNVYFPFFFIIGKCPGGMIKANAKSLRRPHVSVDGLGYSNHSKNTGEEKL